MFAQPATLTRLGPGGREVGPAIATTVPLGGDAWTNAPGCEGAAQAATAMASLGTNVGLALWQVENGRECNRPPGPSEYVVAGVAETMSSLEAGTEGGRSAWSCETDVADGERNDVSTLQPGEMLVLAVVAGARITLSTQQQRLAVEFAHPAWVMVRHAESAAVTAAKFDECAHFRIAMERAVGTK